MAISPMIGGMDAAPELPASHAPDSARGNARVAALSILWAWLFYFLLNTAHMMAAGSPHQPAMAARRFIVTLVGMLLTAAFYLVLRRVDDKPISVRLAVAFLASVPVAFAHSTVNYYSFCVYAPLSYLMDDAAMLEEMRAKPLLSIVDTVFDWYFFIAAWAAVYIALSSAAQSRRAEQQAALYRAEAQAAQLRALRYQLNPHFLFNTLNSLSALVLRGSPARAERMIETLAAFLRTMLTADPSDDTTLADEIRIQRLYLDIEQVRFPDRLRLQFEIPPALEAACIPGLLLQPLVENAIKYGVARSTHPVTITIRAYLLGDILHIAVEDDGAPGVQVAGYGTGARDGAGHGVGLANVAARLRTRFGAAADCRYGPRETGGFRVDLAMPLRFQPELSGSPASGDRPD